MICTLDRTVSVDRELSRRADRKLRRYGVGIDDAVAYILTLVVESPGRPRFAPPVPLDFEVDGTRMRKRRGVSLPVDVAVKDGLHTATADEIGLDAFAETKDALAAEVREQLAFLWKEYALADDAELTESARKAKRRLLATFEEADRA